MNKNIQAPGAGTGTGGRQARRTLPERAGWGLKKKEVQGLRRKEGRKEEEDQGRRRRLRTGWCTLA
jgi:hypothetical protein